MKSIFTYVAVIAAFALPACASAPTETSKTAAGSTPVVSAATTPPRQAIIFIPQTDQAAASWLKLFDRYPSLRMVIAMSPRFTKLTKDPMLKEQVLALQKAGRLELALQLPNAPFLPLIINSDSAKAALPLNTPLPTPAYQHPEDAAQIIAKAKTDVTAAWGSAPKGLVLPQGAANADVLKLLNQLGFSWAVGALGAPAFEGAYRSGGLFVWDATPAQDNPHFRVDVWDERLTGNADQSLRTLSAWAQDLTKKEITPILPSDTGIAAQDFPADASWGNRTWTTKDWSSWIGGANKNAAWSWLRKTRDALEGFKNSGQASVRRLDMAFEELYNAENANYFSGITEGETNFPVLEEREREFKATLSSVYRLIGQPPPDTLFSTESVPAVPGFKGSSTTVSWETLPDGRGHLTIEDAANDDHGDGHLVPIVSSGPFDLRRVDVWVSSQTLDFAVTLGSLKGSNLGNFQTPGPLIDLYIDLNGQPNVGTVALLPGRGAVASPSDAWEYALTLWGTQAQFYRTRGPEAYDLTETVPLVFETDRVRFSIPRDWLRGNPQKWGYQVLVMLYDPKSLESDARPQVTPDMEIAHRLPVFDLIDPLDIPQDSLLMDIEQGKRNDIPFVRVPR